LKKIISVDKNSAASNERFAKIAALSRRKGSGILNSPNPLEANQLPQLRQAATTLGATERSDAQPLTQTAGDTELLSPLKL